ncbi:two-component system regulatory protein YycI [Halobacillus sp. B29]|uniref:two-component system regulatory protein YycI n=1 Tax=Halobacillus sp. B29 TaxID=3457432 RepID=UPI003FCEB15A
MQWGQIKVLFILSFLILDLFLLQQFLEKQQTSEIGPIATANEEDFETELENNEITVSWDNIPSETPSVPQTMTSGGKFSEGVLSQIQGLKEGDQQNVVVQEDMILKGELNESVEIDEENIENQVNNIVPFSNQYELWNWNEEEGVLLFFQKKNDRTIFFNTRGFLMLEVKDGEITNYVATLLSFSDTEEEDTPSTIQDPQLIQPRKIIQKLMDEDQLTAGDEVTSMEIGYYNSINLVPGEENGPQVFAPTWKVTVNGEENLFVFAITGAIIDNNESDFIQRVKSSFDLNVGNEGETSLPLMDNENSNEETNNGVSNE